jgi:hypothetical protein
MMMSHQLSDVQWKFDDESLDRASCVVMSERWRPKFQSTNTARVVGTIAIRVININPLGLRRENGTSRIVLACIAAILTLVQQNLHSVQLQDIVQRVCISLYHVKR